MSHPISRLFLSKNSRSVSRHNHDSHLCPPASALCPNSSLLASLFVGIGLCSLRLAGNNSAEGSSSSSVASTLLRHIQSFHTSTERSNPFKRSCCLLAADGRLSPCQSTSSKCCCISCRCGSSCTIGINAWTLCLPLHISSFLWYHHECFFSITFLNWTLDTAQQCSERPSVAGGGVSKVHTRPAKRSALKDLALQGGPGVAVNSCTTLSRSHVSAKSRYPCRYAARDWLILLFLLHKKWSSSLAGSSICSNHFRFEISMCCD